MDTIGELTNNLTFKQRPRFPAASLVKVAPLLELVGNWREYLAQPPLEDEEIRILAHVRSGRPLGNDAFVSNVGHILGRDLTRKRPGPKRKDLVS